MATYTVGITCEMPVSPVLNTVYVLKTQAIDSGSYWRFSFPTLRCFDGVSQLYQANGASLIDTVAMNNIPLPTPGERQEVVKAESNIAAQQQIANQIYTAVDFAMAAAIFFALVVGWKVGANTNNRAMGRGGDV